MAMHPSKAPGIDGMTTLFFQTYWHILGPDVTAVVQSFFHNSHLLQSINQTLITLIPKNNCPTKPEHFRPISLCNVIYKLITKILANRLRNVLPQVISENQSGFVGGRQISDNVLVSHEVMHSLKNRRYGKKGWLCLKLDMAKAYDRIEWKYIEAVMKKFGFDQQWIKWVMNCVETVSFAVVVNGDKGEFFQPQRGIRQGCPLSPYLFILCAEGFHYLIQNVVASGSLQGVTIGRGCSSISHLFFADDSVLFGEATIANCNAINDILQKYERASGQLVNRAKSSIFLSPNMPEQRKEEIVNALNIRLEDGGGKYLGLPSIIGKSKRAIFAFVKDRVLSRLKGWKESKLNQAGREVLLKSVLMSMPNYVMQCFLLPKSFCQDPCRAISRFWWGSKNGERKLHWVSWATMCNSKNLGGLGFRDIHAFNLAFLAKQGWRLLQGGSTLFQKLFTAKYFPNSSFWNAKCPRSAFWA